MHGGVDLIDNATNAMIIEECMESIFAFDKAGIIQMGNRSAKEKTQYGEALIGKNICEVCPLILELQDGCVGLKEGTAAQAETFLYRSNHTCFSVEYKLVMPEEGPYTGILFIQDVSQKNMALRSKKEAQEEVEAALKMRNEFVANVTHELRTPVNGIKGMAENLLDTVLSPAQIETVNIIIRCSNNMTKIINDLLDFSKIEAGKLTLEKKEFHFRKFIEETMAFNSIRISEKGLKLVMHVASNIPNYLLGDELRLGQIINNLFSNAIKFTAVGQIDFEVVSTYQDENEIELFFVVADTGIGISEEEKGKLFQSFSQVDGSITRRFGGTGLGLAICKQLVELMDGSIQVESEKGQGSTFMFSVRMKIVDQNEDTETAPAYPEGKFVYQRANKQEEDVFSSGGFLGNLMQQNTIGFKQDGPIQFMTEEEADEEEGEQLQKALEIMERLMLSMEMGTWSKAENFAGMIKRLMPESGELKRKAFRMELMVRREDYEKAVDQARELRKMIEKEQNNG